MLNAYSVRFKSSIHTSMVAQDAPIDFNPLGTSNFSAGNPTKPTQNGAKTYELSRYEGQI